MTRVLVTGGTGFIGQHLVSALAAGGRQVRVLDVRPPTCALPAVEYVAGSVLDPNLVEEALRDVDEVYHLAGLPGMWIPQKSRFPCGELPRHRSRHYGRAQARHCALPALLDRIHPFPAIAVKRCSQRTQPAAAPGNARSLYALENARRAVRRASCGIRVSAGHRHTDDADRTSRSQPYSADRHAPALSERPRSAVSGFHRESGRRARCRRWPDSGDGTRASWTSLHSRRREYLAEEDPAADGDDQRPPLYLHSGSRTGGGNGCCHAGVRIRSRDAPSAVRYG